MSRPDLFTRPVQSDRTSHGYGHTRLGPPLAEPHPGKGTIRLILACLLLAPTLALLVAALSTTRP